MAIAPVADVWAVNDIFTIPAGLRAQARHGGSIVYHVRDLVIDFGRIFTGLGGHALRSPGSNDE